MVWIRGLIFTVLAPGVVAGLMPYWVDADRRLAGGPWSAGWALLGAGVIIYASCLLSFLAAHGTPAPFFLRPLSFLIGKEPAALVAGGLYRISRNPMYVGVVLAILGQGVMFRSGAIALYGAATWVVFHGIVLLIEEPHLRNKQGGSYEDYCRRVPRWLGRVRS